MRIRVKLTIILLACSLLPLIMVRAVDLRAITRLSSRVSEQAQAAITKRVERELVLAINRIADRMDEKGQLVRLIAQSQAELFDDVAELVPDGRAEGDGAVAPPGPAGLGAPPLLTGNDFDTGSPSVPPLRDQQWWRAGVRTIPLVTYEAPVFVPAPGLSLDDPGVMAQASVLARSSEVLGVLSSQRRALVRSQYVCLENGLHMSFPGKGGYPEGYDGRARAWYRAGLEATEPVFIGPVEDAITGELRMTCAVQVRSGDRVIGVTAVDISIQDLLDTFALPPELALGSETLAVALEEDALVVVLSRSEAESGAALVGERAPLEAPDAEGLARIDRDLRAGRSGVVSMERDGRDCFWAYAQAGPRVGVVMIVPVARIDAMFAGVRQDLRTIGSETFRSSAAGVLVVIMLAFVAAYLVGRTLSRPIRRLADAAEAVAEGDLAARADVRPRKDEIGKLARAFNEMVPKLADRMRLRESVALANDLQQGLLPSGSPSIPGFDVFGIAMYCDETGGDYFDYLQPIQLGEGRYGVVLGDVTGHGIPAALVMTSARALIQSHARQSADPGEILTRVNETVARDSAHGRFVTLVLLVLDLPGRNITLANAGHDPGLVYRAASGVFDETPIGGLPLAIDPGETYETFGCGYPDPGDVLLVATDGVWESRDEGGAFYGKERMRAVVAGNAGGSAEAIGRALLDDLAAFRGSAPMLDDVTFIVMKATGGEPSER